jgi:hypothetical protein
MVTWLSDVDGTGWDRKELTDTGYGKVHGIWGGEVKEVSQTFTGMPTHTEVKITARFWAIDSWDNEWGYMHIDGVEQWKGKCGAHTCTPDFQSYSGTFPNPWGGEKSGHKCYHDIDVTIAHAAESMVIKFSTNINQGKSDEAWAFSHVKIALDSTLGHLAAPVSLGMADDSIPNNRLSASSFMNNDIGHSPANG